MKNWKTIIMSDLHLGANHSQRDKILEFLDDNTSEKLILNGDIIDGWALKRGSKWKKSDSKILRKLIKKSETGTEVIWIQGNHDDFLESFRNLNIGNIEIVREYIFWGLDKRLYYCFHGDALDFVVMKMRWLALIAGASYDLVIKINTLYNWFRKKLGFEYHSLANIIKRNVKGALNFIERFENNAKKLGISKGCQVTVCGHIHQPKLESDYMNSGDFCENSTCLVEDFDGKWWIIDLNVKNDGQI
jgi:UDP-2,3-diacylglucosamine pyrophosphatase LpxH